MTPFVSFAQNYEDVVLWRALRHVEQGFYVDVGAADPCVDSVTRAFYDRGWSGINIEPSEEYFARLVVERQRDLNLRVAIGARAGVRTLYVMPGTGLSTVDPDLARRHARDGLNGQPEIVPVMPLTGILESQHREPIHFLKIDAEGSEREVLEGTDLEAIRPWIVLLEATEPNSQVTTRHLWEDLLLDRGYEFAYFDGLNCFYLAREQSELRDRLALPPNVFDQFRRASDLILVEKAEAADRELQRLAAAEHENAALRADRPALQQVQAERDELSGRLADLEGRLAAAEVARAGQEAQLEAERGQARQREGENAQLAAELSRAREEEASLSAELAQLHAQHAALVASRATMAGQVSRLRAEVLRGHNEISSRDNALRQARGEMAALARDLTASIAEQMRLREHAVILDYRVRAMFASHSWRVTHPVRKTSLLLRRLLRYRALSAAQADLWLNSPGPSVPLSRLPAPSAPAVEEEAPSPVTALAPTVVEQASEVVPDRVKLVMARLDALRHARAA